MNRQGADVGTQYRSIILYHDEAQKLAAEKSKAAAQKNFKHPIVTEIAPLTKFYPAENHHQEYYDNNSNAPYCQVVIAPKLEKLEKEKVIQEQPQTGQIKTGDPLPDRRLEMYSVPDYIPFLIINLIRSPTRQL